MESQEVRAAVVGVLRPTIDRLTDEVLESVVEAVPPFAEWWGGRIDVRLGVHQGILGFLDLLESGPTTRRCCRATTSSSTSAAARSARAGRSAGCWPPTASARRPRGG